MTTATQTSQADLRAYRQDLHRKMHRPAAVKAEWDLEERALIAELEALQAEHRKKLEALAHRRASYTEIKAEAARAVEQLRRTADPGIRERIDVITVELAEIGEALPEVRSAAEQAKRTTDDLESRLSKSEEGSRDDSPMMRTKLHSLRENQAAREKVLAEMLDRQNALRIERGELSAMQLVVDGATDPPRATSDERFRMVKTVMVQNCHGELERFVEGREFDESEVQAGQVGGMLSAKFAQKIAAAGKPAA